MAARATLTVDLRNTDDADLAEAERRLRDHVAALADGEGVEVGWRQLARFEPVTFDPAVVDLVERTAAGHGHTVLRLPSGAGHDAQMFARVCPTGMVFVPSRGGVSHNPAEYTHPADLAAGAQVLADVLRRAGGGQAAVSRASSRSPPPSWAPSPGTTAGPRSSSGSSPCCARRPSGAPTWWCSRSWR